MCFEVFDLDRNNSLDATELAKMLHAQVPAIKRKCTLTLSQVAAGLKCLRTALEFGDTTAKVRCVVLLVGSPASPLIET